MKAFRLLFTILFFGATSLIFSQVSPTTSNKTVTITENQSITINLKELIDDDAEVDTTVGSITIVTQPKFAVDRLEVNDDGTIVYVHNGSEVDNDSFTFRYIDGDEFESDLGTITIDVELTNDKPVINGAELSVDEGQIIEAVIDARDAEGSELIFSNSQPAHGQLIISQGKLKYIHDGSENFDDTFTITATEQDDTSSFSSATFNIEINGINDAPISKNISVVVPEGSTKVFNYQVSALSTIQTEDFFVYDPDSANSIEFKLISNPLRGEVSINNNKLTYTHDGSEINWDEFEIEISDESQSTIQTVKLSFTPVNDAPVADDDNYYLPSDSTTLEISKDTGVLQNDTDAESDSIKAVIVSNPTYGELTLNEDGSFTYNVITDGFDSDSFEYKASDGNANSSAVTVTIEPQDIIPFPDYYELDEGQTLEIDSEQGLLINDKEVNGLSLKVELVENPTYGQLTLNQDGSFTYTHDDSDNYSDVFKYKLINANEDESKEIFVRLNISNQNDAPVASITYITLQEGGSISFIPNYVDTDTSASEISFRVAEDDEQSFGTFSIDEDTGLITYVHNGSENFSDSFDFEVTDGELVSNVSKVNIEVIPVNDAPTITEAETEINVIEGGVVSKDIVVSDVDTAEEETNLLIEVQPEFGTLKVLNSQIIYTHDGSTNFEDTFSLKAFDGLGFSQVVNYSLVIEEVNDAPNVKKSSNKSFTIDEGTAKTLTFLDNLFEDEEGDEFTVSIETLPENGTLESTEEGFIYTHDGTETLNDSFVLSASDNQGETKTSQKINVSVEAVNDAPILGAISDLRVDQLDEIVISPSISDPDSKTVTITIDEDSVSGSGEIVDNGDNTFTYIDATEDVGDGEQSHSPFEFDLIANDGEDSSTYTVSISIDDINEDLPQVVVRTDDKEIEEGETAKVFVSVIDNNFYSKRRDLPAEFKDQFTYIGDYNGHSYYYSNSSKTYSSAITLAKSVGGYLASIETEGENTWLTQNLGNSYYKWIGYLYDFELSKYTWSNNSTSDWTSWGDNQPANVESQTAVTHYQNGLWYTQNPDNGYQVIVEFDKIKAVDFPITFNVDMSGTSEEGVDYETLNQTITIPANSTEEVEVQIVAIDEVDGEGIDEPKENIIFKASRSSSNAEYYVRKSQSEVSIDLVDNDFTKPQFSVNTEEGVFSETGGVLTVSMDLANAKAFETSIVFDIAGTATFGEDFNAANIGYISPFISDQRVDHMIQLPDGSFVFGQENSRGLKKVDSNGENLEQYYPSSYGNHTTITTNLANAKTRYIRDIDSDENGFIYFIDDYYIRKINTQNGLVYFVAGGENRGIKDGVAEFSQFQSPNRIAVSADGNTIYVQDSNRIRKIFVNSDGKYEVETVVGNGDHGYTDGTGDQVRIGSLWTMKVNGDDLYFNYDRYLRKLTGNIVTTIKNTGNSAISDIEFDSAGNIYYSHYYSHALYKWNIENDLITQLIRGDSGNEDGPVTEAKIDNPMEIVFTQSGDLLFSERDYNQIRKIDFVNKVRVLAGETKGEYSFNIINDNLYELDETITLSVASSSGLDVSDFQDIEVTIKSEDLLPEVQLYTNKEVYQESDSEFIVYASLGNARESTSKMDLDLVYSDNYDYIGEFNGSKYYVSREWTNWEDAYATAKELGGSLAVISSLEENEFIRSNNPRGSSLWIGYTDKDSEGEFSWINNSNSQFTNWGGSEPNDAGGNEDYTELRTNGDWNDLPPSVNIPYVIEFSGVQSSLDTKITLKIDEGIDAANKNDYTLPETLEITIPAGESRGSLTIGITDDTKNESAEFVYFSIDEATIENGSISSENGSGKIEILDNEKTKVTFSASSDEFDEESEGINLIARTEILKQFPSKISLEANLNELDKAILGIDYLLPSLNIISTFAGDGTRRLKDGLGESASLNYAHKIIPYKDLGYLIADSNNHVIRLLDHSGNLSTFIGTGQYRGNDNQNGTYRTEARLSHPYDIAISDSGEIFIAEAGTNSISKIDIEGNYKLIANSSGHYDTVDNEVGLQAKFRNPRALEFDSQGNLYVIEQEHRIRKITFDTQGNASVSTFAGNGNWDYKDGALAEARFTDPWDILIDDNDIIYISEHNRIRKIEDGNVSTLAGSYWGDNDGSFTSARFRNPYAMSFDSQGNILVVDENSNALRKIYLTGENKGQVETLIPVHGTGYVDGEFSEAALNRPMGIVADDSRILISDTQNHRIREISLKPYIIIEAGQNEGVLPIAPIDDRLFENPESISFAVTSTSNVNEDLSNLNEVTVNINSNDPAPIVKLFTGEEILDENNGLVEVDVLLTDDFSSVNPDMDSAIKANYYFLGEFEGSRYYSSKDEHLDHSNAKKLAESLGGHLAIIESQKENDFITDAIYSVDPSYDAVDNRWLNHWIGYTFDTENEIWEWQNTLSTSFENWRDNNGPYRPSSRPSARLSESGMWDNISSNSYQKFIIEFSGARSDVDTAVAYTLIGDNEDFDSSLGDNILISKGDYSSKIVFTGKDDSIDEGIEEISLTIDEITSENAEIDLDYNNVVLKIKDDEYTPITLASTADEINESDGEFTITASIEKEKLFPISVRLNFAEEGASIALYDQDFYSTSVNRVESISEGSQGFLNGPIAQAKFEEINGMVADSLGNLYFMEWNRRVIRKYDIGTGLVSNYLGGGNQSVGPRGNINISRARAITFSPSGELYYYDEGYRKIKKLNASGNVEDVAGNGNWGNTDGNAGDANFRWVHSMAFNAAGDRLYVMDNTMLREIKFSSDGEPQVVTLAGANENGNYVDAFGKDARFSWSDQKSIIVDDEENVIITDSDNHRIRKYDVATTEVTTIAGRNYDFKDGYGINASFRRPTGITKGENNTFYIADWDNNRIRKMTKSNSGEYLITTVAGNNEEGFVDGIGDEASFSRPRHLVFFEGNLFVYDHSNYSLRNIAIAPIITINPGEKIGSFNISAIDDVVFEQTEDIKSTFEIISGGILEDTSLITKINSDDTIPIVKLSATSSTLDENGSSIFIEASLIEDEGENAIWTKDDLPESIKNSFYFLGEFNGHKYYQSSSYVTFNEANDLAQSFGAQIVSIETSEENQFLRSSLIDATWLAITDTEEEGTWKPLYGSSDYLNFDNNEGNQGTNENHAVTWGTRWYDVNEFNNYRFVVEFGPTKTSSLDTKVTVTYSGTADRKTEEIIGDYSVQTDIITIPAGSNSGTLEITPVNDDSDESIEIIDVKIESLELFQDQAIAEISEIDNNISIEISDDEKPTITLSIDKDRVAENNGEVIVTASLSNSKVNGSEIVFDFNGSAELIKDFSTSDFGNTNTLAGVPGARGNVTGPKGVGRFNRVYAIEAYKDYSYLVSDHDNRSIRIVDKEGKIENFIGNGNWGNNDGDRLSTGINNPLALGVDENFNVYFSTNNQLIYKMNVETDRIEVIAGSGDWNYSDGVGRAAKFREVWDLKVNNDGSILYLLDRRNTAIRKMVLDQESGKYEVSTITIPDPDGNFPIQVNKSLNETSIGWEAYAIDVDWEDQVIYVLSQGSILKLDVINDISSQIKIYPGNYHRLRDFVYEKSTNQFIVTDTDGHRIISIIESAMNTNLYSEKSNYFLYSREDGSTYSFYKLKENEEILEAVFKQNNNYGTEIWLNDRYNQNTGIGDSGDGKYFEETDRGYFRGFEPGTYKIQLNTSDKTYTYSRTTQDLTNDFEIESLSGGNGSGYVDDLGDQAQFSSPWAMTLSQSEAVVFDWNNALLRSVKVFPSLVVNSREKEGTMALKMIKDQYFEGIETMELDVSDIRNGFRASENNLNTVEIIDATSLVRVENAPFEGVQDGKVSWGDYDRDGDMDLLLMGQGAEGTITRLYRNDEGEFIDSSQNFKKFIAGDAEFVDLNQDGWLDIAFSGNTPEGRLSELYINRGDSGTVYYELSTNYSVAGLSQSDMEFADLDNDGDQDLVISGIDNENQYQSRYYTNIGNFNFKREDLFPNYGIIQPQIHIYDANQDGDLDLGIAGFDRNNNFRRELRINQYFEPDTQVYAWWDDNSGWYRYNGYQDILPTALENGYTVYQDFNLDGSIDYLAMGVNSNGDIRQFSNLSISLDPILNPKFDFADYNNDGLSDVIITGEDESGVPLTKLYVTTSGEGSSFQLLPTDIDLVALRESSVDWIDYDLDGDLDLFMTGLNEDGVPESILYKAENYENLNQAPAKIENLSFEDKTNGLVRFYWDAPTDDVSSKFRYALRVGTTPGGSDILYANSTDNGTRLINEPELSTLNYREIILDPGTYYASVQAIDVGNRGGEFSEELSIEIDYDWKKLNLGGIIDRRLAPQNAIGSQIEFADIDGDGDKDLIGSNLGTKYRGSSGLNLYTYENDVFSPSIQFGGGKVTFALGDINKNGHVDIVYAQEYQDGSHINFALNRQSVNKEMIDNWDTEANGPIPENYGTQPLDNSDLIEGGSWFPSLFNVKSSIQDFDNDGLAEVLLLGQDSKLENEATALAYILDPVINDESQGYNNFYYTRTIALSNNQNLSDLSLLSYDAGDVDGDGDYDIVISGFGFEGYKTILFENTGDIENLFAETDNNFAAVREGSSSLLDFDGDGLLDIVITGQSKDGDIFLGYKNVENINNFAKVDLGLAGIRKSSLNYGDFNGDGYYDLLYSGVLQGEGKITKLAEYDSENQIFKESDFDVSRYLDASIGFGDFDGDGDLDFVLSGQDGLSDNNDLQVADVFINVSTTNTSTSRIPSFAISGDNSGLSSPTITNARRKRISQDRYEVTLDWEGGKNKPGNPDSALTYELKVGTSKNGTEILTTVANSEGLRAIATKGNAEGNESWKLNLPEGKYYAQVQSVDASFQGSSFSETFEFAVVNSFKLGDANGDDNVNVLDLTTVVEFIMTGTEPLVFVPEVADVNLDSAINVTDISGIVEIILNPETATSRIALSKAVDKSEYFSNKVVGEAELVLQNGAVKLRSDREVVAIQLSVNKDAAIRMNDRLASNFNVVSFERDNRIHYLVYSLNNQDILGVTDQLFTVSGNTKLDVSDLAANAAGVGTLSIDFLDESYLDQYINGAVFYPNPAREVASLYVGLENAVRVQVELFNMQGTPVLQYATERDVDQINLNVSNLSSGLYAARIQITTEDGRTVTRSLKLVIQ